MAHQATKSIIVKGEPDEIFGLWANFEIFPNFMKPIQSVMKTGERPSHWVVEGPLGRTLEWDAETTTFEQNKRIAWKSINDDDGNIKTSGQVTFTALPQNETQITVTLQYVLLLGTAGGVFDMLFTNLDALLLENLRDFKAYVEDRRNRKK